MRTQQRETLEHVRLRPSLYSPTLPVPHAGQARELRPLPRWPNPHTQLQGWIGMNLAVQQAWHAWADNTLTLSMAIWRLNARALSRFLPRPARRQG